MHYLQVSFTGTLIISTTVYQDDNALSEIRAYFIGGA
jgi:hypothetical protein